MNTDNNPPDVLAVANMTNAMQRQYAPELARNPIDVLADVLGIGQVPMRRKQAIFKPKAMAVVVALALRSTPPPALLVRFDSNGVKTTEPLYGF